MSLFTSTAFQVKQESIRFAGTVITIIAGWIAVICFMLMIILAGIRDESLSVLIITTALMTLAIVATVLKMLSLADLDSIKKEIKTEQVQTLTMFELVTLPGDYISELNALEKRWRKQGLLEEEIQFNKYQFERDLKIGYLISLALDLLSRVKYQIFTLNQK